jgi:beta-glucanase (GH16 family)
LLAVTACVPSSAGTESSIQEGALEGSDAAIVSSDFLPAQSGWSLVWSDEFNGEDLDPSKWAPEVSCWGGGNEERQCYTARNANIQVADGVLRIVARPERWTGPNLPQERRRADDGVRTQPYTSGKIRTRDLAAWRYGRFAARMRLPSGQGTWPAFWMMPSEDHYGTWPLSGEIDIMEAVNLRVGCDECGSEGVENRIQGALHFGFPWPDNTFLVQRSTLPALAGPDEGFHVYAVEWGEGRIDWYVDGQRYFSLAESDWHTGSPRAAGNPLAPFDRPFYLILNLAVGGRLPEQHNETGVDPRAFPAELLVDWVRVYECPSDPEEGLACMSAE